MERCPIWFDIRAPTVLTEDFRDISQSKHHCKELSRNVIYINYMEKYELYHESKTEKTALQRSKENLK
jgi:hypothetical protein